MAATSSQMLPLGTPAPSFSLADASGTLHSLDGAPGSRAYLVMFICNHCPFVIHVADELARIGNDFQAKNLFARIAKPNSLITASICRKRTADGATPFRRQRQWKQSTTVSSSFLQLLHNTACFDHHCVIVSVKRADPIHAFKRNDHCRLGFGWD